MIEITNIRQGAILNHNHGTETEKSLTVLLEGLGSILHLHEKICNIEVAQIFRKLLEYLYIIRQLCGIFLKIYSLQPGISPLETV